MIGVALRCSGLVKHYADVVAVNGLDLEVGVGECFGLLGPNGAGKTTTVEIFEGLLAADAGDVEVLGERWRGSGRKLRERMGIQLQETQLSEKLSVLETVRMFRSFYAAGVEPRLVLEWVGLQEKSAAWVKELSGGQRQRLSLACALVGEPELLFLDEPTTGLDPQSRRMTWMIIRRFRERGGTVLLTTHYMEEAQRLCDRVGVMDRGQMIAEGTPRELIASLGAEHVVEFESEQAPNLERLAQMEGVEGVSLEGSTLRLTVTEVHRALPLLLSELERQQVDLSRLSTHHATLEDVFVDLTGRHLRDS